MQYKVIFFKLVSAITTQELQITFCNIIIDFYNTFLFLCIFFSYTQPSQSLLLKQLEWSIKIHKITFKYLNVFFKYYLMMFNCHIDS